MGFVTARLQSSEIEIEVLNFFFHLRPRLKRPRVACMSRLRGSQGLAVAQTTGRCLQPTKLAALGLKVYE